MTYGSGHVYGSASGRHLSQAAGEAGLHALLSYFPGSINRCPGCAGTQWFVGRETAQCAICDTALPLAQMAHRPARPLFTNRLNVRTL